MLPDSLATGLKLVICGSAAGKISAARGAYYANPQNKFWRTLHTVGLTPRLLQPKEFPSLLAYGIGLTDLVVDQAGNDNEISRKPSDRVGLREKIMMYQPKILAFNGKASAQYFLEMKSVPFGLISQNIGQTQIFVLPSTSGAASGFWNLAHWQELANLVAGLAYNHPNVVE